jgi:hypothetical protein
MSWLLLHGVLPGGSSRERAGKGSFYSKRNMVIFFVDGVKIELLDGIVGWFTIV